jgi:hypothetical protein
MRHLPLKRGGALAGGEKQKITSILGELNLPWKKTSEFK